ncbi:MAG: NAD(P)/FAD-dependent oxidoreductase [Saprospiraceae bacterium]|nr:NAD(P)/FAD-dependent oxidoreductase [Saprospiraceae bacterium]
MNNHHTLIIGAGPAGLAVAGRMRQAGLEFTLLESSDRVGVMWSRHYDRLCLHTVKQLSHLPLLDFPTDYPVYVPRKSLLKYFEHYARHFNIRPEFGQKVSRIQKNDQGWEVTTGDNTYQGESVVICTGINRVPIHPHWEGENQFAGSITHSADYRNPAPFKGKKVLVIGMGNTGAEIALDLAENAIDVSLSVRSPITIVPRDIAGNPVQLTAKKLDRLPWGIGDWLGTQIRKMVIGNLGQYGVPLSKTHPAVQLRETGKTPVIDLGTVAQIKKGKIKILPDVSGFDTSAVRFNDGSMHPFDAVILATGYRAKLEEFIPGIQEFLDQNGYPKAPVGDGVFRDMYFVGFDNYKLGGILGTIYDDSLTVVEQIRKNTA